MSINHVYARNARNASTPLKKIIDRQGIVSIKFPETLAKLACHLQKRLVYSENTSGSTSKTSKNVVITC
jgi:hypothetical protein